MGSHSKSAKARKRRRQKKSRKEKLRERSIASSSQQELLPSNSESYVNETSSDLFGSPGSPPASNKSPQQHEQLNDDETIEMDEVYGIDSIAMQYELDYKLNFDMDDGSFLTGDSLTTYLKNYNKKLSTKVNLYREKYEQLKKRLDKVERDASSKVESIRTFYRNMLYYGNTTGAVMLKASIAKTSCKFICFYMTQHKCMHACTCIIIVICSVLLM